MLIEARISNMNSFGARSAGNSTADWCLLTHCFTPMRYVSRVPVQKRHGQDEVDGDAPMPSRFLISIDQRDVRWDRCFERGWMGGTYMALYAKLRKRSAFAHRWRDWKYASWDAMRSISSATAR